MIVVKFLKRSKDRLIVKWFCWSLCAQECHGFVLSTSHSIWWWTGFKVYQSWGRVSFLATHDYKISPNLVCLSLCSVVPTHFTVYIWVELKRPRHGSNFENLKYLDWLQMHFLIEGLFTNFALTILRSIFWCPCQFI